MQGGSLPREHEMFDRAEKPLSEQSQVPFSPDKNVTPVFSNNRTEESNSEYQAAATSTSKK